MDNCNLDKKNIEGITCNSNLSKLLKIAKEVAGCDIGQTSEDNNFTLVEVECLGACVNCLRYLISILKEALVNAFPIVQL